MLGDSVRRRQSARNRPKPPSAKPRRRGLRWRALLPALLVALVLPFAIGYAVAVLVLFPAPAVQGVGIPVPELVGIERTRAQETVRALGLAGLEVTELPHPTRPRGVVTAQSPIPGQQLRAGAVVRVAVSSGAPRVIVPDILGFTGDRAADLLTRLGFMVERVIEESGEARDRVIGINPQPGTELELPARVAIILSAGPPELPVDTLLRPDTLLRVDTMSAGIAHGTAGRWPGIM